MTGLSLIAVVLLLHIQNINAQCTTPEMRTAILDEALAALECESYTCAFQKVSNLGNNHAVSCAAIMEKDPSAPSGYYWLRSANGSAVRVFCDMTLTCKGVGGGWMQVIKLDMTNSSHQCPNGTRLRTDLFASHNKRLCGITFDGPGCSSTTFDTHGIGYTQVCGKIIAYQDASNDAFGTYNITRRSNNIDSNYVDGISLTHGQNPRKHIWTFAGALDEVGTFDLWKGYCPCTNIHYPASSSQPPSFVGNDYFCDTGSTNRWARIFYPDDPLWDHELVVDQPTPAAPLITLHGS